MAKRIDRIIAELEDVRNRSTLQTASFSMNPDEDEKIKKAIRLWARTWITLPLDEVIEELKNGR